MGSLANGGPFLAGFLGQKSLGRAGCSSSTKEVIKNDKCLNLAHKKIV